MRVGATVLVIWLIFAIGWIANLVQIYLGLPPTISAFTPMLVFKILGVFVPPVGSILGYFGMFI